MNIESVEALRSLYPPAKDRAVKKQLSHLDRHCRQFITLSPFVVLSSSSAAWTVDASPRGGVPGFVKTTDEHTLLLPDAPGNNRLDTLENILATRQLGLLFLIPGVDETLRVNGTAVLSTDEETLKFFADERRPPKLVIKVTVKEAYLHCAKALMRSSLWSAEHQIDRAALPTMGQMLKDQIGGDMALETQEEMVLRYAQDL